MDDLLATGYPLTKLLDLKNGVIDPLVGFFCPPFLFLYLGLDSL